MTLTNSFKKPSKKQQQTTPASSATSTSSTENKYTGTFTLEPSDDEFELVQVDDDDTAWTDEQLMDDARPGRRRQAEMSRNYS